MRGVAVWVLSLMGVVIGGSSLLAHVLPPPYRGGAGAAFGLCSALLWTRVRPFRDPLDRAFRGEA